MHKFHNNGTLPAYNRGLPCVDNIHPLLSDFLKTDLFVKWFTLIISDESTEVVCTVIEAVDHLIKKIGPALIHNSLDEMSMILLKILEKKIKCNNFDEENDEEYEQENEEVDTQLSVFESASDLITRLAKVLGAGFFVTF